MIKNKHVYLCKNLVYFIENSFDGYICTLTGEHCNCQGCENKCSDFEEDREE